MPAPHFTPRLFSFLRDLAANNDRQWFAANKERYERDVRGPALRFVGDFSARLAKIAPKLPPRGFAPDHPFIEDLKRTDFVTSVRLADDDVCSAGFMNDFTAACRRMTPLVRFAARAQGLAW